MEAGGEGEEWEDFDLAWWWWDEELPERLTSKNHVTIHPDFHKVLKDCNSLL